MEVDVSEKSNSKNLFLIVTLILVFIVLINPPIDADMWWHLKSGQTMFQQRSILTNDPFSFTRIEKPWVNAFWISDLILYLFYALGGFPVLIGFIALVGVLIFFLIYNQSKGSNIIRAFIIILSAISVSPQWTARPQIFSFLLFTLLLLGLEKRKLGNSVPFYCLPVLFVVWANVHGGFIWGFLLLFATFFGRWFEILINRGIDQTKTKNDNKRLAIWTIISAGAILINPNGIAIWKLPFYTLSVSIRTIQEWAQPNFQSLEIQPFLWIIFLLIIGLAFSPKKLGFPEIIRSIGFIYMAFISQRNIPIAVIVLTPLLINLFDELFAFKRIGKDPLITAQPKVSRSFHGSKFLNIFIVFLLLIATGFRFYSQLSPQKIKENYPVAAVQAIQSLHPDGKIFNSYNWGGYLIWSLPEYPVFIDGRADLYGNEIITEWWDVVNGNSDALTILDKYAIKLVILEQDWPIIEKLIISHWSVVFKDDHSIVLTRQ